MLGSELRLLIKGSGKTVQEAANELGISRQTLQSYFNRAELDVDIVESVKTKLGLHVVSKDNKKRKSSGTPNGVIASAEDYYTMMVPLVNKFAYAGYLTGYGDDEYMDNLPTTPLQVSKEHKGNYMAFEVRGDSMDDGMLGSLCEGYIAYGREIPREKTHNKRLVPIHETVAHILSKLNQSTKYVFQNLPGRHNRTTSWATCNKQLKRIVQLCGIKKHITWHCARHTFGTLAEGDDSVIAQLLGHKGTRQVRVYRRTRDEKLKQAIDTLKPVKV